MPNTQYNIKAFNPPIKSRLYETTTFELTGIP